MHLVKWIRKNMSKLMAVFVILIMVAFVVPQLLTQLARPKYNNPKTAYWLYGDNEKITPNDIKAATNELAVLSGLYADKIFFSQNDLKMILLGNILFSQSVPSVAVSDQVKKMKAEMRLPVSNRQIDKFFSQTAGKSELLWILLKAEAKRSGCAMSTETAGAMLNSAIPQITNSQLTAADLVASLSSAYHMTDKEILQIFADCFTVVAYANIVSDVEDVTDGQMRNIFAGQFGRVDANGVVFNAASFLDKTSEPTDEQITAQFEKYKSFYPSQVTANNPYGFGYKLQPRVQLEYMIVKCSDVKKLVTAPTEEDLERYYQANLERFVEQVKKDEQDPNSEMVSRQMSYAEVASAIRKGLLDRKIIAKSSVIINEAIELVETKFASMDFATATTDEFKANAGSYTEAAAAIEAKYGILVVSGKTGLVNSEQLQRSPVLSRLAIQGQSRMPSMLAKMAFAVDELGLTAMGPYEAVKPKVYLSFGPMFSGTSQPDMAAAVRVVDYASAEEAKNVSYSYEKNLPTPDLTIDASDNVVAVKELAAKDLKRIEAMGIAKAKGQEFMTKVSPDSDWAKTAEDFQANLKTDYPDISVAMQDISFTKQDLSAAEVISQDVPMPELYMSQIKLYNGLVDVVESQFATGQAKPNTLPLIVEYKPYMICYCIKDMTREYGNADYYNQTRSKIAYQQDASMAQALVFEHYLPENINKRMNFRIAKHDESDEPNMPTDANNSLSTEGAAK